jgi:hypothetical protein
MKILIFYLFILFPLLPTVVSAEAEKKIDNSLETRLSNFKIDENFRAGEYLIYDCKKKAYTCVDDNSFETCKMRREESKNKKQRVYLCAPLKKFPNRKACLLYNYDVIQAVNTDRFCFPKN